MVNTVKRRCILVLGLGHLLPPGYHIYTYVAVPFYLASPSLSQRQTTISYSGSGTELRGACLPSETHIDPVQRQPVTPGGRYHLRRASLLHAVAHLV